MNSNESISDIEEEDFLLIKYNTLKHLKLDLFVAADNPLHDSFEALKGDIVPARGAIASAKNIGDLQVALYQMRAKMKAMEDIAKKDKIHSVGEYIKTVAKKIGLYEEPKEFYQKQKEYYAEKRRSEAIEYSNISARQEKERQKEKEAEPDVGILEGAKKVAVFIGAINSGAEKYRSKLKDILDGKSLKDKVDELKGYDDTKWLGVSIPLKVGGVEYELIKGKATQIISKYSLESVGINPGENMAPRDMLSFLNRTDNVMNLVGQSVGVSNNALGLDGKTAVWSSQSSLNGAVVELNNDGGSILRVKSDASVGDMTSAWTHSFVNYSLPGSISSLNNDVMMSDILSSSSIVPSATISPSVSPSMFDLSRGLDDSVVPLVKDKPVASFAMATSSAIKDVSYVSSVSDLMMEAARAVSSGNPDNVLTLKKDMDTVAGESFWKSLMGEDYLKLGAKDKERLATPEMASAVKDYVTDKAGDIGLISVLYKNDLLDMPGLGEGVAEKLKRPNLELSEVVEKLKLGYIDVEQVLKSAKEVQPIQVLSKIADMREGLTKVDSISPATVELLGRYVEKRVLPSVTESVNEVSSKSVVEPQFNTQMSRVLRTVLGDSNVKAPVRDLTQEQVNRVVNDFKPEIAKVVENAKDGVAVVKQYVPRNINLDLTEGIKPSIEKLTEELSNKVGANITSEQKDQIAKAVKSEVAKLQEENKPTPKLEIDTDLIREKRAQAQAEMSAEDKARKKKEEEDNNPYLRKLRAPSPTDVFDA